LLPACSPAPNSRASPAHPSSEAGRRRWL